MKHFLASTAMVVSLGINAEPIVITDYGGESIGFQIPELSTADLPKNIQVRRPQSFDIRYPVSSSLQPGFVAKRSHGHTLSSSIFIIGVDSGSIEWLEANYAVLVKKNAMGFVTNIRDKATLSRLQQRYPKIEFSIVPVGEIAKAYGLTHYPVLIDRKEIVQ